MKQSNETKLKSKQVKVTNILEGLNSVKAGMRNALLLLLGLIKHTDLRVDYRECGL